MFIQVIRALMLALVITIYGPASYAAPYAALVMDARTGKVVYSENADKRLHPASLTKMMTLYLVFTELRSGRMTLDQKVTVSKYAASKPPSKLGLKPGQQIELRYLVRASAVKSANDAATVLAEAVAGSEAAFARRMTSAAKSMGMKNTTFRNASGLTQEGHLSTARDMAILGRHVFYDFPEYYNLFSRRSTDAKIKTVYNTNRRLLNAYEGADGIKTGYTNAAGFNLVASAKRGQERVIVSVFGGQSSAWRNQRVAELMDLGFGKMPRYAAVRKPRAVRLGAPSSNRVVNSASATPRPLRRSTRPKTRAFGSNSDALLVAAAVDQALAAVSGKAVATTRVRQNTLPQVNGNTQAIISGVDLTALRPRARPSNLPKARIVAAATQNRRVPTPAKSITSTGTWVVQLGGTHNRNEAERLLLTTALQEMEALEGSSRNIVPTSTRGRYRAQFVGLAQQDAQKACARLAARQTACEVVSQGG